MNRLEKNFTFIIDEFFRTKKQLKKIFRKIMNVLGEFKFTKKSETNINEKKKRI